MKRTFSCNRPGSNWERIERHVVFQDEQAADGVEVLAATGKELKAHISALISPR
jgi:hypothetical protein